MTEPGDPARPAGGAQTAASRRVYRDYDQAALDAQYDQRRWVPDAGRYLDAWQRHSAVVRAALRGRLGVSYGPGAHERLDIFLPPAAGAPVIAFIHGGAWRMALREDAAYAAPPCVAAGACFVALGFDVVPDVDLAAMIDQVRRAIAWLHAHAETFGGDPCRLVLAGFSSGAHLAACVLADGWRASAGLPETLVRGAVLASGPYDLEPVARSARNTYLRLDAETARRYNPLLHLPASGPPVDLFWGADESDEFRRQGADFAATWRRAGLTASALELPGHNHFDIGDAFARADSPLVAALLHRAGLSAPPADAPGRAGGL